MDEDVLQHTRGVPGFMVRPFISASLAVFISASLGLLRARSFSIFLYWLFQVIFRFVSKLGLLLALRSPTRPIIAFVSRCAAFISSRSAFISALVNCQMRQWPGALRNCARARAVSSVTQRALLGPLFASRWPLERCFRGTQRTASIP